VGGLVRRLRSCSDWPSSSETTPRPTVLRLAPGPARLRARARAPRSGHPRVCLFPSSLRSLSERMRISAAAPTQTVAEYADERHTFWILLALNASREWSPRRTCSDAIVRTILEHCNCEMKGARTLASMVQGADTPPGMRDMRRPSGALSSSPLARLCADRIFMRATASTTLTPFLSRISAA